MIYAKFVPNTTRMFVRYGNILHLTDGSRGGSYGSKTPLIQIWAEGFEVSSAIDSSPGATPYIKHAPPAPVKQWTPIQVVQGKFSETYHFNISVGDKTLSIINQKAESFSKVQVYASSPWLQSQPGKIRRLRIESDLVEENLVTLALGLTTSASLLTLSIALLLFKIWQMKKCLRSQDDHHFYGLCFRQNGRVRDIKKIIVAKDNGGDCKIGDNIDYKKHL